MTAEAQAAAPAARMMQFQDGLRLTHMLCALAEIGVADHLTDGPMPVEQIARLTDTHADPLYRVLRAVASKGVFTEVSPRVFGLTELASTLRTGVPGSLRDNFRLQGQPFMRDAYAAIEHTLRTGESSFAHVHGTDLFSYLAARPESADLFSRAMGNAASQVQRQAIDAYDLSGARRLVDVGGAHGHLVAAILSRYPELTGVVFDLPHVVQGAAPVLSEAGVSDRAELAGGDYLRFMPADGDVYVLSHVLHQLSDHDASIVLTRIREAMRPGGRVLVIDPVLPPGDAPHPGKFMDITMLTLTEGRDRTEYEFACIFEKTGFRLAEIVALSSPSSVVVATAR